MERVNKKSFIITTLLMPILMLALMAAPALIMTFVGGDEKSVIVVDETGFIGKNMESDDETQFIVTDQSLEAALKDTEANAIVYLPANIADGTQQIQFYSNGASSLTLESNISRQVNSIIEGERLKKYNIENLDQILDEVHSDVQIQTFRNDSDNPDNERASSTGLSYVLGFALTFLLYMFLLLYGQMVMTSIIEEKNNRVLELVVSSVKPTQLMLGKICGIGLVAVTQIVIWGILLAAMAAFVMPAILPTEVAADLTAMNAGQLDVTQASIDTDFLQALSIIGNVNYILGLFGLLILFLIGGFMLYAAIYAAIGSSVDNIQDAGQLQSIVIFPIIFGMIFGMTSANDPTSSLAFWMSMIPFTSPMVMMARIPFGIPSWEICLSLAILVVSFFAMIWVAAKIYRVGIFMYGKKPTLKELIRWARYK